MAIEKTLVLIKPDGVKRNLIGEITSTFEQAQLKVVEMKMLKADEEILNKHYVPSEEWLNGVGENTLRCCKEFGLNVDEILGTHEAKQIGLKVKKWLIHYMSSDKIVAMVLEGNNAVSNVRRIVGKTIPSEADPGSIRGKYSCDSPDIANAEKRCVQNLIHASGNKEEAEHEINLWFKS